MRFYYLTELGKWVSWNKLHNEQGYCENATTAMNYLSAQKSTWGERPRYPQGYYDGDTTKMMNGLFFRNGISGWYTLNELASMDFPVFPAGLDKTIFVRNGVSSDAVSLTSDGVEYSLIKEDVEQGWMTASQVEARGWNLPNFLMIDGTTGAVVGGAVYDGILTFPTTYHTIDDDAEVIFVAVEQRTISFINTEHPEFDVPLPATISQDYGSTATLPSVSGTYEDADYTYTPSAWSIGAFGASITLRNNLVAVLLWDETPKGANEDTVTGTISSLTLPTAHNGSYTSVVLDSLRYYAKGSLSNTGSVYRQAFGSTYTWHYGTVSWTDATLGNLSDKITISDPNSVGFSQQTVFKIIFISETNITGLHPYDTTDRSPVTAQITEYTYNNGTHNITFMSSNNWLNGAYVGRIQFRYLDSVTMFENLSAFDLINVSSGTLSKATETDRYDMYNVWGGNITIKARY